MSSSSRSAIALQLGLLTLLSAFLLFQVQPVISKFILPWFGGSPGVWTTCVLFFQIVLFAGYAYAHLLTQLPRRWQLIIHGVLVLAAAASLPIAPGSQWKPPGGDDPTGRILLLLLANVALPYFVLSSTSPLVQVWFSRAGGGHAPWRLYALSNLGSLAALLSYPFFFEPRWDVMQQTWMWSGGFVGFAVLSLVGVYGDWKHHRAAVPELTVENGKVTLPTAPAWSRRVLWLVLPAVASVLLLASTNHLCQDVAVIPFLWVLPLSLYLLTFIICFEHERWYVRWLWAPPAMVLLFAAADPDNFPLIASKLASKVMFREVHWDMLPNFHWEIGLVCAAMFFGCMVCHGELARLKPDPSRLTEFYLMMSAGGALGGLFVSQMAPRLYRTFLEWPGVLTATFGIASVALLLGALKLRSKRPWQIASWLQPRWISLLLASAVAGFAGAGLWHLKGHAFETEKRIEIVRNFYGVISVEDEFDDEDRGWRKLYHGGILHGTQYLAETWRNEPLSYYGHKTGVGLALLTLNDKPDARVGVVGMGTGTVASYGTKGQVYRFYDINPDIVRFARRHFHYLEDLEKRGGIVEVKLGDARLSLEHDAPQQFDALLLDAFSGDSVPVHLLTREAFEIYRRHMKPDGIIAVHVSNRYLTLAPVVERVAASVGMKTTRVLTEMEGFDEATDYVMVTNNEAFLKAHPPDEPETEELEAKTLWTDRKHNLFECLMTGD